MSGTSALMDALAMGPTRVEGRAACVVRTPAFRLCIANMVVAEVAL